MQNFRGKYNIDDISLKILGLLQENARMSYTEIGQKIGMASTSVKERVQKLEDVGIIKKYTVQLDDEKLGYPINAIITLSCSGAYTPKEQVIVDMLSVYPQDDKLGKFGQIETSFIVTSFINNLGVNISKN